MAAIDPDAVPEYEDEADSSKPPRATLKIVRLPDDLDFDEDEDEEDSDDEEINGGPSDKTKAKIQAAASLLDPNDPMEDDEDESDEETPDIKSILSQVIKGKAPATGDEDEDDEDEEGLELEETVVCTLDTEKVSISGA